MLEAREPSRWAWAMLIGVLFLVALHFCFSALWSRGREEGYETVRSVLNLSGKGDYDQIVSEKLATPAVVNALRDRDKTWGKVQTMATEHGVVDLFGTTWHITMRLWRERKAVREVYSGTGRLVVNLSIPFPDAEK